MKSTVNQATPGTGWAATLCSYRYASLHHVVTLGVLGVVARDLVVATLMALVGYVLLPTAPRYLTAGYVDVLAAMPSMHVGWSLWVAIALRRLTSRPWLHAIARGYPVFTTLVVVATGSHWVLDAVTGAVIVLLTSRVLGARTHRFHSRPRAPVYDGRSTTDHHAKTTHRCDLRSTVVATGNPRPGTLHGERPVQEEPCTSVST